MKRVAITGASGLIGTLLVPSLRDYKVSRFSLPWSDLRRYATARRALARQDVVINLAWNVAEENNFTQSCSAENTAIFLNIYKAAVENRVRRVIVASSVHVDDFHSWNGPGLITVDKLPAPDSMYGAHKLFLEAIGQQYSRMGLEVVCLRLGGVQRNNLPPTHSVAENAVFLSHEDCISLVKCAIDAPLIPNGFAIIHGVSNSANRIHDTANSLGWRPTGPKEECKVFSA